MVETETPFEPINNMERYTSSGMSGLISWASEPGVQPSSQGHFSRDIVIVSNPSEKWDEACSFVMGERCSPSPKYFQLTLRRNIDEIVRMGPFMTNLDSCNLSSSKKALLQLSIQYVLYGCHMFLSAFCRDHWGIISTPQISYARGAVQEEFLSFYYLNKDLFYERFPSSLVRILYRYRRDSQLVEFDWSVCCGHGVRLDYSAISTVERRQYLALCGFYDDE